MRKTYIVGLVFVLTIAVSGTAFYLGSQSSPNTQTTPNQSPKQSSNKTGNSPTDTNKTISLSEIKNHDNQDDCWMAINGIVYNPTDYINQHPGGNDILEGCGVDATKLFKNRSGEGPHSSFANDLLAEYKIGTLQQ